MVNETAKRAREQKKLTRYPLIYKLECHTTGLIYIGKTIQKIYERKGKHMYDYRNRKGELSAHKVIENDNWDIYELERVFNISNLSEREQFWIDNTRCVNICNAIKKMTSHESQSKYSIKHKEFILKRQRDCRKFSNTWGGDPRYNCNLLSINMSMFD